MNFINAKNDVLHAGNYLCTFRVIKTQHSTNMQILHNYLAKLFTQGFSVSSKHFRHNYIAMHDSTTNMLL